MSLLRHYFRMILVILKNDYKYNKVNLIVVYTKLTIRSILFHKLAGQKQKHAYHHAKIAGNTFKFSSYSQAIPLFEEIFIAQQYKFDIADGQAPYIIDCGSNIGLSILYFKMTYPDSTILAFEPDPDAFRLLEQNIQRNNIAAVTLYNTALSDEEASVQLYANNNGTFLNMSLFQLPNQPQVGLTVDTKKLSDFISNKHTFVKIDTEGSEYNIIKDLIESNAIKYINQIIVECHDNQTSASPQTLIQDLEANRFLCKHFKHPLFANAPETMVYARQITSQK